MVRALFKKNIGFLLLISMLVQCACVIPVLGSERSIKMSMSTDKDQLSELDLSSLPSINLDIVKEQWTDEKIEMLIITPDDGAFIDAVTPLAEWKNQKGVKTLILSNFSLYDGKDTAEKIRNMIKAYHENENIQWVLLAADAQNDLIPIREVYNPDTIEVSGNSEYSNWDERYKPTDYYYADLDGTWDDNGNSIHGESAKVTGDVDEIEWNPDVYVGRLPASTASELSTMVSKQLNYEKNPTIGDWMNRMLLGGAISTTNPPEDEARLTQHIWYHYALSEMNFTHLHRTTSSFNPIDPPSPNTEGTLSRETFRQEFNKGYSAVIFAGHGEPSKLISYPGTEIYLTSDAESSSNTNMPSLVYADACTTNAYDKLDNHIGEVLMKKASAGAIGYIGSLRVTWYFEEDSKLEMLNRGNAKLFWKTFLEDGIHQQGKALYESKVAYMTSDYFLNNATIWHEWERKNLLTYNLLGDPELDVYTNKPRPVANPFPAEMVEGDLVSFTLKDGSENAIPNGRINFQTESGKYRTIYSDAKGNFEFRLPFGTSEDFDVTITGHDLVPSYFTFSTIQDTFAPNFTSSLQWSPTNPSISDNLCFNVSARDDQSGLEGVYVLSSNNEFKDFTTISFNNASDGDASSFSCVMNKLDPGTHSLAVVARDYAGNTKFLNNEILEINIEMPVALMAMQVAMISSICLIGVFVFFSIFGMRSYKSMLKRFEELPK